MNIAYILHTDNRNAGATKSFMIMLRAVMEKGVKPCVVIPSKTGIYNDLVAMGIPVLATTYRANAYPDCPASLDVLLFLPRLLARLIVNRIAYQKVISFLSDKSIDLIHSNVSVINIGYLASRHMNVPHIFHIREYVDKDFYIHYFPFNSCLRKRFTDNKNYTICITKDIQAYHKLSGVPSSRVIYNGIMPTRMNMPQQPKDKFILFAGRIQPAKDVDNLLEGYLKYTQSYPNPLPLKIAGAIADKSYYDGLLKFIKENHIEYLVSFIGNRNDINILMQKACVIVIPSHFEAFGRCMAEAMFNGCLTIGRNTGGTKEQLDNGLALEGEEIALRYETTDELAGHLSHISSKYNLHLPYIKRAFHCVNTLYTSESNTEAVYKFYHDIMSNDCRNKKL